MKVRHRTIVFVLLIYVFSIGALNAQGLLKLKNDDNICFMGNSITQDGRYHMILQAYYATRFPGNTVRFYNCGIAGDVADGMLHRLDKDILSHKPDYAFIMTGMNDIQRYLYAEGTKADSAILAKRQNALDNYYLKTEKLATSLLEKNVKLIFMTPSIYDQTAKIERSNDWGANDALKLCAVHIRKLAKKYNAPLVDLFSVMDAINAKEQISDSSFTIVGHDRIHPGDVGHFVMTYEIIRTLVPSKYVCRIEVDAKRGKVEKAEHCSVEIEEKSGKLKFKVLEEALPFPVRSSYSPALNLVPFQGQLNNEMLTIRNLKEGNYELQIDGITIKIFSSQELNSGINLAEYSSTPQHKQAENVFDLCAKYHKTFGQLRNIGFVEYRMLNKYSGPNTAEGKRAYLDSELEKQKGKSWYDWNVKCCNRYFELLPQEQQLSDELNSVRTKIYSQNKPVWHEFKLIRIEKESK